MRVVERRAIEGISGRYARALFSCARENHSEEEIWRTFERFLGVLKECADLQRLVFSPTFSNTQRLLALDAVLAKLGIFGFFTAFLKVLVKNKRLALLEKIAFAYQALYSEQKGEVTVDVVSAFPLSPSEDQALKECLSRSMGRKVFLSTEVDPKLLGGFSICIASFMVDYSLRTRLMALGEVLRSH